MNAYIFRAALYCENCAYAIRRVTNASLDSDQHPQGPYRAGGGYADRPQHCENCGTFLQNPLTDDGLVYIREVITAEDMESPIVRTWMDFYKKDLDAQANKGAR